MHVLMLPSWYPEYPGDFSGSFFAEQAEALVKTGHSVGVLAVRGTPLYQLRTLLRRPRGTRRSIENGVVVLRHDIAVPVPYLHRINQVAWNRSWRRLFDTYVEEFGVPDVLHAHSMFPGGLAAAQLSRDRGVPFVVTEHRPSSIDRLDEPWMRVLGEKAAGSAGALVAVARRFGPMLDHAYRLATGSWEYVPGLLSPQFEHLEPRAFPSGPFTVGHVSHLDPGKRVSLIIEAFSDAFPSGDERLRIAGESVYRAELERVAHAAGIAERVDFVGAVPRADIADEFAKHHVFALASEAEAFGTVLWEAMACGIPLVSTATWAGHNAVSERNGLMVPIDDRAAFASALRTLRERAASYDAAEIRDICIEHCGQSAFVTKYVDVYAHAVNAAKGHE